MRSSRTMTWRTLVQLAYLRSCYVILVQSLERAFLTPAIRFSGHVRKYADHKRTRRLLTHDGEHPGDDSGRLEFINHEDLRTLRGDHGEHLIRHTFLQLGC